MLHGIYGIKDQNNIVLTSVKKHSFNTHYSFTEYYMVLLKMLLILFLNSHGLVMPVEIKCFFAKTLKTKYSYYQI